MEPKILKNNSILVKIFFNCILPLLVGLLIYIFLRTGTYINNFFGSTDINNREISDGIFMSIFRYNLPDFLWAYSMTSALLYLRQERVGITYLLSIVFFISVTEVIAQKHCNIILGGYSLSPCFFR